MEISDLLSGDDIKEMHPAQRKKAIKHLNKIINLGRKYIYNNLHADWHYYVWDASKSYKLYSGKEFDVAINIMTVLDTIANKIPNEMKYEVIDILKTFHPMGVLFAKFQNEIANNKPRKPQANSNLPIKANDYFKLQGGDDVYLALESNKRDCNECCANKAENNLCYHMPPCCAGPYLKFKKLSKKEIENLKEAEIKIIEYKKKIVKE